MRYMAVAASTHVLAVAVALLAGCDRSEGGEPSFAIGVAPLTLPGVTNACYRLTVTNGPDRAGEVVFQEDAVCADDFGDGVGSITYIGPCDADSGTANSVTLELLDLYQGTSAIADSQYVNPCGELDWSSGALLAGEDGHGPCTINRPCEENADVAVVFDITILRNAQQGFFDIAVNFDDIFCSAKLDCVDAFLHDAEGERSTTAILGFACTSGTAEPTTLYMNDIRVECADPAATYFINPALGPGQHGPAPSGAPVFFQTATYSGREAFTDFAKCYWNQAIGLDLAALGRDCHLYASGTAGATPFGAPNYSTPPNAIYPVITWSVPLTGATGELACGTHPLNGDNGVATTYTAFAGERFSHRFECGEPPSAPTDGIYHVTVDGSDTTGTGSQQAPWRTVAKALGEVGPGDVIRLGPGDFDESVHVGVSGEEGAPIVIEGTRGPGGELLSRLHGGVQVDPTTWTEAFEVGPNVYRNAALPFLPGQLIMDGKSVPRVHANKAEVWLWRILALADDGTMPRADAPEVFLPFWGAIHGVYGYHPDEPLVTYLRLADGRDPRESTIRVANGAVVAIVDAAHVTLRGLVMDGGEFGVEITGHGSHHVVVEDCHVSHGRRRIQISVGASHVTVRNNVIEMKALTAVPGAWTGGTTEADNIRYYIYDFFKHIAAPNLTSDDRAIMLEGDVSPVSDMLIEGNQVIDGLIGLECRESSSVEIRNNHFENLSSGCLALRPGALDVHFHDNVVENANFGVRPQDLADSRGHLAYIYRNLFFLNEEADRGTQLGTHIYLHTDYSGAIQTTDPEIYVYHNSFMGGSRGFGMPVLANLRDGHWLKKFVILNNLISAYKPIIGDHYDSPEFIGAFDYNWVGGVPRPNYYLPGDETPFPLWYGPSNAIRNGVYVAAGIASDANSGDLVDAQVLNNGVNLSQTFTANETTFPPLPGMSPGYFEGVAPDIGAVQFDQ